MASSKSKSLIFMLLDTLHICVLIRMHFKLSRNTGGIAFINISRLVKGTMAKFYQGCFFVKFSNSLQDHPIYSHDSKPGLLKTQAKTCTNLQNEFTSYGCS